MKGLSILLNILLVTAPMFSIGQAVNDSTEQAYKKAVKLREKSIQWSLFSEASEKLLIEANSLYPGLYGTIIDYPGIAGSFDRLPYLRLRGRQDIRGANKAWSDAITRLKNIKDGRLYYKSYYAPRKNDYGTYVDCSVLIYNIWICRLQANLQYGDYHLIAEDIDNIISHNPSDKEFFRKESGYDGFQVTLSTLFSLGQYHAFLAKDKPLLSKLYETMVRVDDQPGKLMGEAYMAILNNDYSNALTKAKEVEQIGWVNKHNGRMLQAWIYALQGERLKSEEIIKQLLKNVQIGPKAVARIRGINALKHNQFQEVLETVKEETKITKWANMDGTQTTPFSDEVGKFFYYTLRGDAYLGLKQFDKARSQYELALLYYAEYEPALTGLANLEGRVLQERHIDKTPPLIKITEPAIQRGLKVSAVKDIMIKGIAEDLSGIKSVIANGQELYTQSNGNFWGNLVLNEGLNQINLVATDLAGNIAEQIIEIEKGAVSTTEIIPVVATESKNYALVIAAQNYDDSAIPSLENPVSDAIKLKQVLKNSYSFAEDNIFTLFNPIASDLKRQLAELNEVIQPEDNLIIFYAGHGIWIEKEKKGYWLLTDAKRSDVNTWLSNKLVLEMIAKVPSRHTLLITDACFSGSVFKTRSLGADAPAGLREMSEKISRVAITSGNDSEVPDESVFMKYLVKALSENKEKYLTAQKMFITQIIEAVMNESKTEPRYGTLELAGHVGGDYIFTKK
ncbi:hypothetical protein GZH53_15205 [Flavihumibacter sp. R14]|nr:hypothetical protein [Flavihumibacter soli]